MSDANSVSFGALTGYQQNDAAEVAFGVLSGYEYADAAEVAFGVLWTPASASDRRRDWRFRRAPGAGGWRLPWIGDPRDR